MINKIFAKNNPRHFHRILGTFRVRDRTHEWLVRIFDMAVDHIKVALVNGQIYGLTHRSARMVQARTHVSQLDKIFEVLDRRITPALIKISDKG